MQTAGVPKQFPYTNKLRSNACRQVVTIIYNPTPRRMSSEGQKLITVQWREVRMLQPTVTGCYGLCVCGMALSWIVITLSRSFLADLRLCIAVARERRIVASHLFICASIQSRCHFGLGFTCTCADVTRFSRCSNEYSHPPHPPTTAGKTLPVIEHLPRGFPPVCILLFEQFSLAQWNFHGE
jgi:hypothetical protein